ncbi:MAG: hypothetical protein GXO30_04020 [Epsilonproteobacteria bacterium]|nr:hypothetical protein [Campylobacterota bacterium]
MKYIITNIALILLLLGCADKNAFTRFDIKKEQELGMVSLQNSKIKTLDDKTKGIISVVYLNDVYPKKYKDYEYFYIYFYINDKDKIHDVNFMIKLNNKTPLSVKKLSNVNEFSGLTSTYNQWNSYYLVKFKEEKRSQIVFMLKDKDIKSDEIIYYKDEE